MKAYGELPASTNIVENEEGEQAEGDDIDFDDEEDVAVEDL